MKKVISVKANDDFTLDLCFDDGSEKVFDVLPYLEFPVFRELKDLRKFKDIAIALGTVQWKTGQDISPDTLFLEGREINETVKI